MRSNGTAKELEDRRRLAVQRVEDGWTRRAVAAFLGVHPVTVARWVARFRDEGEEGLAATPTPGRPRRLTAAQEKAVLGWLTAPPTRHGFRTDLWTARRVADPIRTKLKVEFHPHSLREWLRKRGYTPRKPARRARQQNPAEIDRWLNADWPRIEEKSRRTTPTSS